MQSAVHSKLGRTETCQGVSDNQGCETRTNFTKLEALSAQFAGSLNNKV